MTPYLAEHNPAFTDRKLALERLTLTPEQIIWATECSESATSEAAQWQTYLNALALLGVEQWLQERAPDLPLDSHWLSDRPLHASSPALDRLTEIQIGAFKLQLIAVEDVEETVVPLPRGVVESPEATPTFYLLVEVLEELDQVCIYGYLRQDELVKQRQATSLPQEGETNTLVPLTWFEADPDTLLLYLHCLEPTTVATVAAAKEPHAAPAERPMNVGLWLQSQLDAVAQELAWVLLPPLSVGTSMRGFHPLAAEFETMLAELTEQESIDIPPDARGAYRDLQWENLSLRLHVATWQLPSEGSTTEWVLLVLLGTQLHTVLPYGIQLQVRDAMQILEQPMLTEPLQSYLYAQVIGMQQEQFWVTISLANGAAITLPPFTFSTEHS